MDCPVKDEIYLCETPCMVDKCPYQQGAKEFAKFLIDKGIDVVDLHAEFQEGRINND